MSCFKHRTISIFLPEVKSQLLRKSHGRLFIVVYKKHGNNYYWVEERGAINKIKKQPSEDVQRDAETVTFICCTGSSSGRETARRQNVLVPYTLQHDVHNLEPETK
jgi:hypothetical protein